MLGQPTAHAALARKRWLKPERRRGPWSHSLSNVLDPDFRNHKHVFPESKERTLTVELPKWEQTCSEDSPVELRQSQHQEGEGLFNLGPVRKGDWYLCPRGTRASGMKLFIYPGVRNPEIGTNFLGSTRVLLKSDPIIARAQPTQLTHPAGPWLEPGWSYLSL